ncbi:MAG: T9SS type A sorting domain-containing protein [Candidatus Latescibacterota bacterium]|nr:MAG: T9SS type A sorting domain-containing protein [Candidatus Latescibacterota bacterium]
MCARIRFPIIIFIFIGVSAVCADAAVYQWSHSYGDAEDQVATSVALDNVGNVILVGHFDGTVDFGGGALVCDGPSSCMFLSKLDRFGNHVWSRNLGDSLKYGTNKLAIDGDSNVFLVNDFHGTADFGGGLIAAQGLRDGIIAKFDAAGEHVWSRGFGGSSASVDVKAAGVDGSGNLIVAGLFTGTIDFGGATLSASWFVTNMFVVKFHPTGAHLWSRKYTGGGSIVITAVAADPAGNTILSGYHSGSFDFGGGTLTADLYNAFVAKYDTNGDHGWSHSFGDPGTYQYIHDVAADLSGNVFVTGDFRDPLDLGGGSLTNAGGPDIFLAKFDPDGNHIWSKRFGDAEPQRSYSVAVDGPGHVLLAGHFFGAVDFGGGALVADPIDFCVARFDGEGTHYWSERFDVFSLGLQNDKEYSIAAAANVSGDMAFVGTFKDAVDCGGGDLAYNGGWDVFVTNYVPVVSGIRATDTVNLCLDAYPNPFNPRTTITYSVPEPGVVRVGLYGVDGRHVRTLIDRWAPVGHHNTTWDGRDTRGRTVASGVYFVRLETAGRTQTKRVVLLK